MSAKSGTAPVPTRPATACDARSAFTWSRIMRNLAIGPAATSIAATSLPAIHRSTKAFSPSCGQKRGVGQSGSSMIAKAANAFQRGNQQFCAPNTASTKWRADTVPTSQCTSRGDCKYAKRPNGRASFGDRSGRRACFPPDRSTLCRTVGISKGIRAWSPKARSCLVPMATNGVFGATPTATVTWPPRSNPRCTACF
jgi:hypothetical protein